MNDSKISDPEMRLQATHVTITELISAVKNTDRRNYKIACDVPGIQQVTPFAESLQSITNELVEEIRRLRKQSDHYAAICESGENHTNPLDLIKQAVLIECRARHLAIESISIEWSPETDINRVQKINISGHRTFTPGTEITTMGGDGKRQFLPGEPPLVVDD